MTALANASGPVAPVDDAFAASMGRMWGNDTNRSRAELGFGLRLKLHQLYQTPRADSLAAKLRRVAQDCKVAAAGEVLIGNEDLQACWTALKEQAKEIKPGNLRLAYKGLCLVRERLGGESGKFSAVLSATAFMALPKDDAQTISLDQLFNVVMQYAAVEQARFKLALFDTLGSGSLTRDQLEAYIQDTAFEMEQLRAIARGFRSTYVVFAASRFLFYLGRDHPNEAIEISALVESKVLAEYQQMQQPDLSTVALQDNWFSLSNVTTVHTQYTALDVNQDGLLSLDELQHLNGGSMSPALLRRLFQEYATYEGGVDYRLYLRLVLARRDPNHPASVRFFFRLLDVDQRGYLTTTALLYFWRAMEAHPLTRDLELPRFEDVKNEIFDMVAPKDPYKITVQDLLACNCGGTVVSILTDVDGFFAYEHRESPPPSDGEDDDVGSDPP